ncbi:ABC transporter ATP-binding protein [Microbacterium sp. SORGH_AS_0454]|uniref:ABC transporter ATP-binding protein n=1 Tax=Microbacterium sp. SORGH_AS_0454 TaxID=3041758 RepID=UPI0028611489|nr:ABC transporter ATP-binding protein [Microbacterium sp. SORGH_AS_0454]MDR6099025.1 ABC-type dipeptide/oligopeptide/nickel transport system ATPase component [Microbacterium sp. SORGH_AS_0454]
MSGVRVRGLRIGGPEGAIVRHLDFDVSPGECVAIVGESGAGKSLSARALLGLVPDGLSWSADELEIDGTAARSLTERQWRTFRGRRIALVSQDALVSLDPLRRIGAEVAEPVRIHEPSVRGEAVAARVRDSLERVSMPEPDERARQYPHELSGGLRQRALIASALSARPTVLVADEPTTALDATVQARVLELIRRIADDGVAVVFISHDLGAVARVADRVVVMQEGRVVETGVTAEVLASPSRSRHARARRGGVSRAARAHPAHRRSAVHRPRRDQALRRTGRRRRRLVRDPPRSYSRGGGGVGIGQDDARSSRGRRDHRG